MQHSNHGSSDAPALGADGFAASASAGASAPPTTRDDSTGRPPETGTDALAELGGATQAVQRWFEVFTDRAAFAARRSLLRVVIALVVAASATLWIGAALLALLRGLCGAFSTLGDGSTWVGDLVGGAVAVGGACGAFALGLRVDSWLRLRALRVKYARMTNRGGGVEVPGGTQ